MTITPKVIPFDATKKRPLSIAKSDRCQTKHSKPQCQHDYVEIDDEEWELTCRDCGIKLNPLAILWRYATEETRLHVLLESRKTLLKELAEKIEAKNRCKCQHCGKMTKIEKGISSDY